jgi:histidinol dehydrogenase
MQIHVAQWNDLGNPEQRELLSRPALQSEMVLRRDVSTIIADVRARGDAAVLDLTRRLDGVVLGALAVSDAEIAEARRRLGDDALDAIDQAIANVRRFHTAQLPTDIKVETVPGVVCERVARPIDKVGLYVPAGSAPLPSAAIMLAVPAAIAGCPTRVLCTPPRADGCADPAVVVAATRAGIQDIFKIGGAQAIAAMAYGTESVPRVSKLFGPGNAWVTYAKSLVAQDAEGAAIDMPAGPSEVLVIADESANPAFVAADLLSQAEHGTDSQVLLVTTSAVLATAVQRELGRQLDGLSRKAIASQALGHSRIVLVNDLRQAVEVSNLYAPEHLILQCIGARGLVADVRNAGSVFVGPFSPESVGDYCSGTNHVLPTYGYARSHSGLGIDQFQRQMTVQELTFAGLKSLARTATTLAAMEGLDAHAAAVSVRLESPV